MKPYFEYLFPHIIAKINDDEGLYLSYGAYPKLEKTFNVEGGLFPKGVSISSKRVINGYSKEQHEFKIIDCVMTTQSGNNQVTHFHGSYFHIQKPGQEELQIRTNGSPKIKGEKYEKVSEEGPLKIYKPVGIEITDSDQKYIKFMSSLKKDETFKHIYLGVNKQSCHLALWYRKNPMRKKKDFSIDTLNQYYKDFMFELNLINELEI